MLFVSQVPQIPKPLSAFLASVFAQRNTHGTIDTEEKAYRVQARHGRLAVHAAHTLTLFVIETWKQRKVSNTPVAR